MANSTCKFATFCSSCHIDCRKLSTATGNQLEEEKRTVCRCYSSEKLTPYPTRLDAVTPKTMLGNIILIEIGNRFREREREWVAEPHSGSSGDGNTWAVYEQRGRVSVCQLELLFIIEQQHIMQLILASLPYQRQIDLLNVFPARRGGSAGQGRLSKNWKLHLFA